MEDLAGIKASRRQPTGSRRRSAEATRAAMLEAARLLFTRNGYDHVGVRDVAAMVGVDAALVIRYFGSKGKLFTEAVAQGFDPSGYLAGDRSSLGERLARSVLQKVADEGGYDPLLVLLRSAPNERAATILRMSLDEQFVLPLARWLGGDAAEERAGLIAADLFGIAFMRVVVKSGPLATDETERLVALVASVLQSYIDDPPSSSHTS